MPGVAGSGAEAAAGTGGAVDEGGSGGEGAAESGADAAESGISVGPTAPLRDRFSVGPDFVCAVSTGGTLRCWGPGAGDLVERLGVGNNRAVSVGTQYSCVLKNDGTPVCTGFLGGFTTAPLLRLDVGSGSFCGIEADGRRVVCRGNETPDVPEGLVATDVSVAGVFACGVSSDTSLRCWGIDQNGVGLLEPPAGSFSQVSAFLATSCAIDVQRQVRCWGYGLVDPAPQGEFESVAVGVERACALGTNGLAACWGFSEPADIVDVPLLAVGIGVSLVCGVLVGGQIRCFGADAFELPNDAVVD
jgi:hypothetical protein